MGPHNKATLSLLFAIMIWAWWAVSGGTDYLLVAVASLFIGLFSYYNRVMVVEMINEAGQ